MYTYICPNRKNVLSCPYCDSKGHLWGNRENPNETIKCEQDSSITCSPFPYTTQISGQKLSKEQIRSERQKRSTNHFKESVYDSNQLDLNQKKYYQETKGFKK